MLLEISDSRQAVSVCMASYNGARFIRQQIQSVLDELEASDELVIVDDASTDDTVRIINSFGDPRIKLHCASSNRGVLSSFEKAIGHAVGQVIFLCDQDDIWYPGKVDHMLDAMKGEDVVAVVSNCNIVDSDGKLMEGSFFLRRGSREGFFWNLLKNGYLGCAMCFRADFKRVVIPFPKLIFMHDEWIGLAANISGKVVFLDKVLFGYRRHSSNVSSMTWGGVSFALRKRVSHVVSILMRAPAIIRYRCFRRYK